MSSARNLTNAFSCCWNYGREIEWKPLHLSTLVHFLCRCRVLDYFKVIPVSWITSLFPLDTWYIERKQLTRSETRTCYNRSTTHAEYKRRRRKAFLLYRVSSNWIRSLQSHIILRRFGYKLYSLHHFYESLMSLRVI